MTATEPSQASQLATFYAEHHRGVARAVAHVASRFGDALIADACAIAWLTLVRRNDIRLDRAGVNWMITVAIHEAWRLAKLAHREMPVGGFLPAAEPGELAEPGGLATDPLDRVIEIEDHVARLERFGHPKPRERRELLLHAAGYRYAEIAALTGSTYTAVNRRLTEGRRRLRAPA